MDIKHNKNNKSGRREFIRNSSFFALGAPFIIPEIFRKKPPEKGLLICQDIDDHLKEIGKWVNWNHTLDNFKIGDPSKPVDKIAVAWKASLSAVKEAIHREADLFIEYEPLFVNSKSWSDHVKTERDFALPTEISKVELIEKSGLVLYRCHELWDRYPGEGCRDSWHRGLNLGNKIIADDWPYYVTEIEPMTVRQLASHVLEQLRPLEVKGILASGNLDKIVSKVGSGTGENAEFLKMRELGADVGIVSDDYYVRVRMGEHANEMDFPTITANHGVAEEWGVRNLAKYLKDTFPRIEVFNIPQYYTWNVFV